MFRLDGSARKPKESKMERLSGSERRSGESLQARLSTFSIPRWPILDFCRLKYARPMTPATTALPPREAIVITTARGEIEPARHFGPVDCVPVMNVVEFEASVAPWYVRVCSCDEIWYLVRVFWLNTRALPGSVNSS